MPTKKAQPNESIAMIVKEISQGIKESCVENEDYFLAKPVTINLTGKEGGVEFQAKVELSFKWAVKDVPPKKHHTYKPLQAARSYVPKKSFTPKPGWEGKKIYNRHPTRRVYKPRIQKAFVNAEEGR